MATQLNINNEDADRRASRLQALTGDSLTAVITRALCAALEAREPLLFKGGDFAHTDIEPALKD